LKSKELHTSQTTINVSAGNAEIYATLVDAKVRAGGSIYGSPKQINKETLFEEDHRKIIICYKF
jgi:hypothetical protein